MRSIVRVSCAALWLALCVSSPAAQDLSGPGVRLETEADPSGDFFAASTTLSSGESVTWDGSDVALYAADGTLIGIIASVAGGPLFPSFVLAAPGEQVLYFGESSNHGIRRVPLLLGSTAQLLTTLVFNYDAAMHGTQELYVSAPTCGFGCGNEIWRVDVASQQTTWVATVPGASGPLAFDRAGGLYYGVVSDQFPPPPTAASIHRWSPAQLASGNPLTINDAELVGAGFAGAARLAYDRKAGALFLLENNFGTGENRLRLVQGSPADSPVLVEGANGRAMGNLSVHSGAGPAVMRPFQPEMGLTGPMASYTTTDFFSAVERVVVFPLRPTLSFSGPGTSGPGTFFLDLQGGPPDGSAVVLFCARAHTLAAEQAVNERELGAPGVLPLFFGLGRRSLRVLPGRVQLDSSGNVFQAYTNPGGWEGTLSVQLLLFDADGHGVGTSDVAPL